MVDIGIDFDTECCEFSIIRTKTIDSDDVDVD